MAHLITVTNSDTKEDILFNLDTVVSIEQGSHNTVITTRWGRTMVKDSLEDIIEKADNKGQQALNLSSHPEYESQQDQYYSTKE